MIPHTQRNIRRIDTREVALKANRVFTLNETQAALEYQQSGTVFGKVVLTIPSGDGNP
jgi:NADPH:quinone reductase-like Zn-dependent oxidoreductase